MGSNICQAENRNTALFIDPDRKQNITEHPDEIFNTEFNDGTEADQDKNPLSSFISAHCNKIPIYASNRLQFQSSKKLQGQSAADKQESSKRKSRLQLKVTAVRRSPRVNQLFQFQSTLKQFIVSKKIEDNNFGRIEINQQKFIFLRKEAIRNHYKMQQEVGEGSYGSVYKAFCLKTTEVRAVKCIKKENFNNSKMYQVFAELQLLKKLDHPNIIKLYEVFEWEGHYQIVTQFCNGGSIIEFIKSRKHLNEEIIRSILKQLLCCLNYLHTLKIVHRDLKLQNVMFIHQLNDTSKSNQVEVKLLDFGSAFKMDKPSIKCTQLVGTISYMPPQIIKGYFTDKCDVWSCGVIFYILLTSKSPFKCKQKEGTLQKILTHQIRFSDKIWSKVTKNAKDLISKMLEKDPFKRISADEALNHPWFKDNIEVMECKTSVFLNDLSFYYRQNNLISVLQSYLTFTKITQQERKNISECFKQIDKNNDGFIQREELIEAYKSNSKSDFNAEEVDFILRKLDKDNSNSINFNEFAAAVATKQKLWAKGALEEAFDYFDTDKTKYIERDELASIIEGSDSHQIEELLRQMDEDGDQKISKNEFINYFLKKGCLH